MRSKTKVKSKSKHLNLLDDPKFKSHEQSELFNSDFENKLNSSYYTNKNSHRNNNPSNKRNLPLDFKPLGFTYN